MNRIRATLLAILIGCGTAVAAVTGAGPASADTVICQKFGSTTIQSGRYVVQNNIWNADTAQCINVTSTGFTITTANHNKPTNGGPASYPSIYAGCHYATCSAGSGLPMQVSSGQFGAVRTSVSMTYPSSGTWDAAYDIWFDPTPRTDGQNTGAEIMVWLNRQGAIQPFGSRVGSASLAGASWDVWFGNPGWNIISYVRTAPTNTMDFAVSTFYSDAVSRGYAQNSWYLTSVQAGFEPWVGGTGLAVNTFSYATSGGGDTSPPTAPQNLAASGVTASGLTLAWTAATDNVGVAGYDVFRRQGSTGSFTQIGSATGTSFGVSGLAASTPYQFYVTARDAAGNTSPPSNTVSVTTAGSGGGSCRVTYAKQSEWAGGVVVNVTIANTGSGTVNGWALAFTFPNDQHITNAWNATVSQAAAAVTARDLGYNATIAPGASTGFGFQATWGTGDAAPGSFALNGVSCATG
ncbi:MAG TPA: cellulose binding domain-containing protein [Micromonosporaceae bacterium]|jgi:chitodextrinase|nr:cellulose binding domain-containing protein [Micromonosporaceae bacterium]